MSLIENQIFAHRGSEPLQGTRSVVPTDIASTASDPLLEGRQKIDPRLGVLVVPFLIAFGIGCGSGASPTPTSEPIIVPPGIGSTLPEGCENNPLAVEGFRRATEANEAKQRGETGKELTAKDNAATTALIACIAEVKKQGDASATAVAQEKAAKEAVSSIGFPQTYTQRPADSGLINYYNGLIRDKKKDEYGSPEVLTNPLSFPVYPKETILGKLNSIDPKSLPGPSSGDRSRDDSGWLRSKREVVNKLLVSARQSLEANNNMSEVERLLVRAVGELVSTDLYGVPKIKPQTPEERNKYEKRGAASGVPEIWIEIYFDLVGVLKNLSLTSQL